MVFSGCEILQGRITHLVIAVACHDHSGVTLLRGGITNNSLP